MWCERSSISSNYQFPTTRVKLRRVSKPVLSLWYQFSQMSVGAPRVLVLQPSDCSRFDFLSCCSYMICMFTGATLPLKVVVTRGVARIWCQRARRSRRRRSEHRGTEWSGVLGGVSAPQLTRESWGSVVSSPAEFEAEPRLLSHSLHILGHRMLLVARKIL